MPRRERVLAGEQKSRRQIKQERAERLRGWSDAAATRATQRFKSGTEAGSQIPLGQPILVGHHSEGKHRSALKRIDTNMRKGVEESAKSDRLADRASGIDRQLAKTIFSDDSDAIQRINEKIATLEAKRDRINAYNKSAKAAKGTTGDISLLDEDQKKDLLSIVRHAPFQLRKYGQFPSYATANTGKEIARLKKRLEKLSSTPDTKFETKKPNAKWFS